MKSMIAVNVMMIFVDYKKGVSVPTFALKATVDKQVSGVSAAKSDTRNLTPETLKEM
jgi:hypothetical protein